MSVAIVGHGWVGRAQQRLFPDAIVYDVQPGYASRAAVNQCEVAFVCVPTNARPDGSLDCSIVEEVVAWCECPLLIIRSTLMPGTADHLEHQYGRNVVVMPEYIGETVAHPLMDEQARPFLIIGGRPENRRRAVATMQQVYNSNIRIRQVSNYEAEVIKLSENRAIAWRVMAAHELYQACAAAGVDYETVRQAVYGDDPRFNLYFTWANPENLGFQSSRCLAKDVPAWAYWAAENGCAAILTEALVERSRAWTSQ